MDHEIGIEHNSEKKQPYEAPQLRKIGSFAELTRGSSGCCAVDFYLYYDD